MVRLYVQFVTGATIVPSRYRPLFFFSDMMPAPNPYHTRVMAAPPNMPECHPLEVLVVEGGFVSCWEPSEEEIEAIKHGEKIWLYVCSGGLPPCALTAGERPDPNVIAGMV